MKKLAKIIGSLLLVVIIGLGSLLLYVRTFLPNVGEAPQIKIEITPARLSRGQYLAHHVCACIDCHSTRDWSKYSGPLLPQTLGKGGEIFDQKFGFPGKFISKNITPFALKNWTDGEIYRAITCGVSKNGKALFPVMPYEYYGKMNNEDIYSIIAYLRTLPEIPNENQKSVPDFPMNFIINTIPKKQKPGQIPALSDTLAYGKYLVNAAGCMECHTKQEKGQKLKGMEFAGGFEFKLPSGGTVISTNITPAKTGLAGWNKLMFVNRFKYFADSAAQNIPVKFNDMNSIMPWTMYSGMTEKDLSAIFNYLQTIPAIENKITRFKPDVVNN